MIKRVGGLIFLCLWLVIGGCVTAIDETLPYTQLPEITVATQFSLVASPAHPTAYLSSATIAAGEKARVIGMDKDAAWLLILHDERIGWMPTFYSRTNVGNLEPAIKINPLSAQCNKYLGATFAPDETWVSGVDGEMIVVGSIYRSQAGQLFHDASLAIEINGQGTAKVANYVHPMLTASSAVVLFAFALADLHKDSRISFEIADPSNEPLSFQAAFFSTTCPDDLGAWEDEFVNRLPIGVTKLTLPKRAASPTREAPTASTPTPTRQPRTPTPRPTLVIIEPTPSGPTKSSQSGVLPAEIEQVLSQWDLIHHESDRTLDPSDLPTVLMGEALQQQQTTLERLRAGNCYWEFTDLALPLTLARQDVSTSEVIVDVQKHWDARLYCNGRFSERDSFDEPFRIRYRLILTDQWRITEKRVLEESEVSAPIAPRPSPPSPESEPNAELRTGLLRKSQSSGVAIGYRGQVEVFVDALLGHLDDFQLPNLGVTRSSMTVALQRDDAGDRLNALVQEIWDDWQQNARARKFDATTADPGGLGFSPFRQLVIRMIQNRQGRFSDSQQHGLYNYFSRSEGASVWRRDPDAVIGAINRESFRWP